MRGLKKCLACASLGLASMLFSGDGSDVPGFVPPPKYSKSLLPPPANMSGGETFIPYPGPPAMPMSRSEKKNPPRPPVILTWAIGNQPDALATPRTLDGLLDVAKKEMDIDYIFDIKNIDEINQDPNENPIIYFTTHYNFEFNKKQREVLREFMLRGGTLILNPGRGSRPAFDSAIKELGLIFPEKNVQSLSVDHPIFHSCYNLDTIDVFLGGQGKKSVEPMVSGIVVDCRAVGIIPRFGIDSCSNEIRDGIDFVFAPGDAQKLGINIMSYATVMRDWTSNIRRNLNLEDKFANRAGNYYLSQIVYNGEWKTRHTGLPLLLNQFNRKSNVPVKFNLEEVGLGNSKILDFPVVFLTGHEQFNFNSEEKKQLRDYLECGGFLIAEACCGREGFDFSFRREINSLFSEEKLELVSKHSSLYFSPNKISNLGITPALKNRLKLDTVFPPLWSLEREGRTAVIYSPWGLQGGWECSQNPYAFGYDSDGSLRLGENILLYSLTK